MLLKFLGAAAASLTLSCAQAPSSILPADSAPVFRTEVIGRTAQAVNYRHRGGATRVSFQGTPIMAFAKGDAKVESVRGVIHISADFRNMASPSGFGPEYLTYVLWAISPDGRPQNLGELTLSDYGNGTSSKIDTTCPIQTFGMIVTAEPYYGVTQPSDIVVMENAIRPDTAGVIETIDAKFELLPRGSYTSQGRAAGFHPVFVGKKQPFELCEAQNAVQLARIAGADKYAPESFEKARLALEQAQRYQEQRAGQKPVITMAREAVVRAEDSRVIALRREQAEFEDRKRQESLARENAAKEKAVLEARQREQAQEETRLESVRRAQAETERKAAEVAKSEAEAAAAEARRLMALAEKAKADADAAKEAAIEQQKKLAAEVEVARAEAGEAQKLRQRAELDRAELRQQLLDQFNQILQTRDTARGLIVNMSDVLFDSGKYTLKPLTREKLAKLAGIVLGRPGLRLEIEGHTDSVGSDEFNMSLSGSRASAVRDYLVSQGISPENVTAKGFGKSTPVADNNTASGRQLNRRVEMVISGEIIGATLSAAHTAPTESQAR